MTKQPASVSGADANKERTTPDGTVQDAGKPKRRRSVKKANQSKRNAELSAAADSAIQRLCTIARPGGDIDSMDIKDLKGVISSIKDLAAVSSELNDENRQGGVIILPEVMPFD